MSMIKTTFDYAQKNCLKSAGRNLLKSLLVLAFIAISPVLAEDVSIDLSNKPISQATLDYLKENNILIPQKEYQRDADGNIVKVSGKPVYVDFKLINSPGSAYNLVPVTESGVNTITKYVLDNSTGNFIANHFVVDLKEKSYGEGDEVKYFGWKNDDKGYSIFSELTSPTNALVEYHYNPDNYDVYDNQASVEYLKSQSGSKYYAGGALKVKDGEIQNFNNNLFINNNLTLNEDYSYLLGGALYNAGNIEQLVSEFVNNSILGKYDALGGALYNDGKITNIHGNFINNTASTSSTTADAYGGAIYNKSGTIDNIYGNFIGNRVFPTMVHYNPDSYGGAIYNEVGTIRNINGNFIGNTTFSHSKSGGGAIYNKSGTIENIIGNFVYNTVYTSDYNTTMTISGGGIYNDSGIIGNINGDFIQNRIFTESTRSANVYGGAIYNNRGSIGNITGDFINNTASAPNPLYIYGGAIYNKSGNIGDITGDFINNKASMSSTITESPFIHGGAIYNGTGTIGNITGDFINNTAYNSASLPSTYQKPEAVGGAIDNNKNMGNITGNFVTNSAVSTCKSLGAAINNYTNGVMGDIKGDFIGNSAKVLLSPGATTIVSNAIAEGGAIDNVGIIRSIEGDFISNTASSVHSAIGGAIATGKEIGNITGDFIDNTASATQRAYGGAIYISNGSVGAKDEKGNVIGGIINSNFYNNKAVVSQSNNAGGGAIFTYKDLNIIADKGTSTFKGNYVQLKDNRRSNQAIYVFSNTANLDFKSLNNGAIYMYDNITGTKGYTVNITGDNTGSFNLYNDIYNANVTLANTTLSTVNDQIHTYKFDSFTLLDNANMQVDVDLKNKQMDRISTYNSKDDTYNYGAHNGSLTVSYMNLISDAKEDSPVTEIFFAENGLKDCIVKNTLDLPQSFQSTAYAPIYKYAVTYNTKEDGGYFEFTRGGKVIPDPVKPTDPTKPDPVPPGGGVVIPPQKPYDNFNPAVLNSPIASTVVAQTAVTETLRLGFQHLDQFSQLPYAERMAIINANKYSINDTNIVPKYNSELYQGVTKGYWIRPYTSFEKINLHNGPSVDAITYGTLVGLDSDFKQLKRGWYNVQSVYAGYNGSSLSYSGVDTTLNGGLLGLTETFYKDNFFTALTAIAGASMATASTMYGNEDYAMLLGGIGAKSGYNIEFKQGKYILQPMLLANYSFVNTFDYTNSAGVKMSSTPLHTLQINPQLKFVTNLEHGWQPYACVGMVWNVLNTTKVKANDVVLPRMAVNPYIEYGLGLQRSWKDKFTGFMQAMVRNGGRNGVALTFGFRWALGKEAL